MYNNSDYAHPNVFTYAVDGRADGSAVGQPPSGVLTNAPAATTTFVKLATRQFSLVQEMNAPPAIDLTLVGMVNCSRALLKAKNWVGMAVIEVGITNDDKFCVWKNTLPTYSKRVLFRKIPNTHIFK